MSFNTSHVTLYPKDRFGLVNVITFQYISCYSLSKGRWNLNLRMMRFNTSHVTLYLTAATGQKITVVFQYISCYSLSAKNWAMDHLECEFQYISCYSLSYQNSETELVKFCFNTSHVTLYQITRYLKQLIKRFQYISCYSLSLVL